MYDAVADPYCYPGSTVLKNLLDLRDQAVLDRYEAEITSDRAREPFPEGKVSPALYCAFHRHLFQDVYAWAGEYRTVRIAKGGNPFCFPEHIAVQVQQLFADLEQQQFLRSLSIEAFAVKGAHFLSELNAIHPFREGNGRTQLAFFAFLAERAGHPLRRQGFDPAQMLAAMITSFSGDEIPLQSVIRDLVSK